MSRFARENPEAPDLQTILAENADDMRDTVEWGTEQ